jgi:EAL domain-containing protein (putative c-di-GMP-specific phosphodiesterase class I)
MTMNSDPRLGIAERPFLEHFPQPGGPLQRVPIERFPFRLGRDATADLVICSAQVSKSHAAIVRQDNDILITDLGSTNGTFVNGRRIQTATLVDGDIIHLAKKEFRFGQELVPGTDTPATESACFSRPRSLIQEVAHLRELIAAERVITLFQPIVALADRRVVGSEALGRGQFEQLPDNPRQLFTLAKECNLSVGLSRAFRKAALAEAASLPASVVLFLNVHSDELLPDHLPQLLDELPELGRLGRRLVFEVHEDFAGDVATFRQLRERLRQLAIGVAYDDFGVGQARLSALTETPADFVKLDMTLVQGLPHSRAMRDLVHALAQICADLGTRVIAEGIETEEEAAVCCDLGCQLGQGYLFGPPLPQGCSSELCFLDKAIR